MHGGRKLHFGARRTWLALGKRFPGHKIPFRWVAEWISKCPVCQKDRLGMENYLEPIYRHIKQERSRKAVELIVLLLLLPMPRVIHVLFLLLSLRQLYGLSICTPCGISIYTSSFNFALRKAVSTSIC